MNYLFKILLLYYIKFSKKEKRFKNKLEYEIIDIMIKVNHLKILMAKLSINQLYLM